MKYKNIKEELIKENGNRCSICGKNFDDDEQIDIDHIVPRALGGKDTIENLQLTCRICNRKKSNKLIYSEAFEECIKNIIKNSKRYEIIENPQYLPVHIDLILKDNANGQYKICKIKTNTIFTQDRLSSTINYMNECKIELKKKYNNIKGVFIFPGKLSLTNQQILEKNGIEIWDRDYLVSEFKGEIEELNNPYFNSILEIAKGITKNVKDKYEEKIMELKKCRVGKESWNEYQELVGEILELLFCPQLEKPLEEKYDRSKTNRRDYIIPNYCQEGFWNFLRQNYYADYIVIDAKNSSIGVKKQDILQVANYLKKHRDRLIWYHFC